MKIRDILEQRDKTISFEFFPPKTPQAEEQLLHTISLLKPLNPDFVSVTYGAMGTTQDKTFEIAYRIKNEFNIEPMAHLTCINADKQRIKDILFQLKDNKVENILALRGDIPEDMDESEVNKSDFTYASELVEFINKTSDEFCVGVAGYPEKHIECSSKEEDIENLKKKVDAGADFVITQLFFDNKDFFEFSDKARSVGINVPIIPGIMPVANVRQLTIFKEKCGVKIPEKIQEYVYGHEDDKKAIREFGIEYATIQCKELINHGINRFHFYTLNRSMSTLKICENLGLKKD